ncbi:hypothetical protein CVT26_002309 [Gymnopilus dilepis]|uniref:Uncharacterized protein n=1 Tax=Gymnopilus dilepis TaxID=231916 RepID=A0A409Y3R3_9AGAR|nr:hypothetical protein CVT26_002309 [Gymnopilus dilepis]
MSAEQATASPSEDDWDRSLVVQEEQPISTPRNSVVFPAEDTPSRPTRFSSTEPREEGKRTLSELLRLHSEKGCNGKFSPEEASRIADVLGQWINASSSPYEGEDDFFARAQSQDDISVASKRPIPIQLARPRGRSESANSASNNSRPPSSTGFITASS